MKSKKILTILLSLAIMFTFMPAMAFATDWTDTSANPNVKHTYTWDDDYAGITIDGEHYPTTITYVGDGMLKAVPNTTGTAGISAALLEAIGYATFYDLNYAEFATVTGNNSGTVVASKYLKNANYQEANGLKFTIPTTIPWDYAWDYDDMHIMPSNAYRTAFVTMETLNNLGAWQGEIKGDEEYLEAYGTTKSTADQSFTLTMSVSYLSTGSVKVVNSIADKAVTVVGRDGAVSDVQFFLDKVATTGGSTTTVTGKYDGAKHTVVMNDVKGYTVKYTVFNKTTNKWDAVDAVEITDVETLNAKAQLYDDKGAAAGNPFTLTVSLTKAQVPDFVWVEDDSRSYDVNYEVVEGTEYNPADYVEVKAYASDATSPTDQDKANAKATAANAELFKAYFNDFYEVTAKNSKAYPDYFTLKIVKKDLSGLTTAERKELGKKYAAIDKNFGTQAATPAAIDSTTGDPFWTVSGGTTTLQVVPASTDYEVEFTKAITSKTYKGSKTTKKGKLKKNQTIQFTAEAKNGAAVVYKLVGVNTSKIKIDKNTGKLTLKKGLAKGTYKFKIKAYVPNHQTQTTGFEVQNVTIKVKK